MQDFSSAAKALRAIRLFLNYSQSGFEEELGLPRGALTEIESSRQDITLNLCVRYSNFLGISAQGLLDYIGLWEDEDYIIPPLPAQTKQRSLLQSNDNPRSRVSGASKVPEEPSMSMTQYRNKLIRYSCLQHIESLTIEEQEELDAINAFAEENKEFKQLVEMAQLFIFNRYLVKSPEIGDDDWREIMLMHQDDVT